MKFSFTFTEINYNLKYIKIENIHLKLIHFYNIAVLLYFWANKCSLGEHETNFKNIKILINPNFWTVLQILPACIRPACKPYLKYYTTVNNELICNHLIKSQKHTYTHTILTRIHKSLLHFYQPQEEYEIHQIQEGEHKRSSWTSNTQIVQKHRGLQDSHTLYVWGPRCVHLWGLRSRRKGSVLINTSAVHYGKTSFIAYEIYHCKAAAHHRLLLKLLPHNSSDSSPELTYRHNTQLFRRLASIFNCTGSNKSLKWISTTTEKCVCIGIWEQYFSLVFKHSVISNKSLSVCV